MNAKHERQMNQTCSENMLIKAADLVMRLTLSFNYPSNVPDVQVDITPAFMFSPAEEKAWWFSGSSQELFEADLRRLDRSKVYFLRTGQNNRAGHWQTLYFDLKKNGWINYSSTTNHYPLTLNDILINHRLLAPHASMGWGMADGQYSFLIVEASPLNLINAVNYLYLHRTAGNDTAIGCLPCDGFLPQIQVSFPGNAALTLKDTLNNGGPHQGPLIDHTISEEESEQSSGKLRTPLDDLKKQLKAYISKREANPQQGFLFFKQRQTANRLINRLLAAQILSELEKGQAPAGIFQKISEKRATIRHAHYPTLLGNFIFSAELNAIIQQGRGLSLKGISKGFSSLSCG